MAIKKHPNAKRKQFKAQTQKLLPFMLACLWIYSLYKIKPMLSEKALVNSDYVYRLIYIQYALSLRTPKHRRREQKKESENVHAIDHLPIIEIEMEKKDNTLITCAYGLSQRLQENTDSIMALYSGTHNHNRSDGYWQGLLRQLTSNFCHQWNEEVVSELIIEEINMALTKKANS